MNLYFSYWDKGRTCLVVVVVGSIMFKSKMQSQSVLCVLWTIVNQENQQQSKTKRFYQRVSPYWFAHIYIYILHIRKSKQNHLKPYLKVFMVDILLVKYDTTVFAKRLNWNMQSLKLCHQVVFLCNFVNCMYVYLFILNVETHSWISFFQVNFIYLFGCLVISVHVFVSL